MSEDRKLYTTKQAAEYIGRSIVTIKRAVENGHLKGEKLNDRMRVFTKAELDAYKAIPRKVGRPRKDK